MTRSLPALAIAGALLTGGCPGPGTPATKPPTPALADEVAALTVPATEASASALGRLTLRGAAGELQPAWERLHYLLDLFDDARYRRADDSLTLLLAILGVEGTRDSATTDAVLEQLLVAADAMLAMDRMHGPAQAARTLLDFDRNPPTQRSQLFQRMVELKQVARGGGPLAANARLRLFGFCWRALSDAALGPRVQQRTMLAMCLYPLYDSDPAPYFSAQPRERPPAPRWEELADAAGALLSAEGAMRLAPAAAYLAEQLATFRREHSDALPTARSAIALGVPMLQRAEPFGDGPMIPLGDASSMKSVDLYVAQLRPTLGAGRGGEVGVALHAQAPAEQIYPIATAAATAGGHQLDLLVGFPQRMEVPPGDYWHDRATDGTVTRLGKISLSLSVIGTASPGAAAEPRGTGWAADGSALRLHLVIGPRRWRLVASTGVVEDIATDTAGADPVAALRTALARVRAAFPDERGLLVVFEAGTTYAAAIAALDAASHDGAEVPLFTTFALALAAPKLTSSTLARRIERRAGAIVQIVPAQLTPRVAVLRRCYQELLERRAKMTGELRLELHNGEPRVTSGPRSKPLRRCAITALGKSMAAQNIAAATVTLTIKAPE